MANLGYPLWGSQSMQELASGIRNVLLFLIRDAKSCILICSPYITNTNYSGSYSYTSSLLCRFHHVS